MFPSAWYANVREIAAKSPLLLSMGAEQFLDKELEINHPLKIENIAPVSIILFVIRTVVFLVCRYVQCHALLLVYRLRPPYNFLRSMPLDPPRWCTHNCTLNMSCHVLLVSHHDNQCCQVYVYVYSRSCIQREILNEYYTYCRVSSRRPGKA